MNILIIQTGHNANVAYFQNGECIGLWHEERFTNIKNYTGYPFEAMNFFIKKYGFEKCDKVVIPSEYHLPVELGKDNFKNKKSRIKRSILIKWYGFILYNFNLKFILIGLRNILVKYYYSPKVVKQFKQILKKTQVEVQKLKFYNHHECHCITPFYFYGLNALKRDILFFSIDGAGDFDFSRVYKFKWTDKSLELLVKQPFYHSLGLVYSELTRFLGMMVNEHEYKVMGLAAYVTEKKYFKHIYDKLRKCLTFDPIKGVFKSKFSTVSFSLYFKEHFSYERFDNLAAAVQTLLEELVVEWIRHYVEKHQIPIISVSGGVFMNVKMNQRIAQQDFIEKVYFQPSCGDESLVIGAAAKAFYFDNTKKGKDENSPKIKPMRSMYYGRSFENNEIKTFLKNSERDYQIEYIEDVNKKAVSLLVNFNVIGLFRGRAEWGARSLCNRAILGNASDLKTFYEVNDTIKMRDFWMPFAPSILDTWAEKYLEDWNSLKSRVEESAEYMILTFNSTPLAQEHLRSAIHQKDKTLRPQIVTPSSNPAMYDLLKQYEKITGMGGVLNTSLNLHGYPLVETPEQAMFTFKNSDLKYLFLENYLLSK